MFGACEEGLPAETVNVVIVSLEAGVMVSWWPRKMMQ